MFCRYVPKENPGEMAGAEGKESGVNREGEEKCYHGQKHLS